VPGSSSSGSLLGLFFAMPDFFVLNRLEHGVRPAITHYSSVPRGWTRCRPPFPSIAAVA
jgi:hypothetical protein